MLLCMRSAGLTTHEASASAFSQLRRYGDFSSVALPAAEAAEPCTCNACNCTRCEASVPLHGRVPAETCEAACACAYLRGVWSYPIKVVCLPTRRLVVPHKVAAPDGTPLQQGRGDGGGAAPGAAASRSGCAAAARAHAARVLPLPAGPHALRLRMLPGARAAGCGGRGAAARRRPGRAVRLQAVTPGCATSEAAAPASRLQAVADDQPTADLAMPCP
jgi:hypothetical protein